MFGVGQLSNWTLLQFKFGSKQGFYCQKITAASRTILFNDLFMKKIIENLCAAGFNFLFISFLKFQIISS